MTRTYRFHTGLFAALLMALLLTSRTAGAQQNLSLDSALMVAGNWAMMADVRTADRMWLTSGPVMQKNVRQADWINYLTTLNANFGSINKREWIQVVRVANPPNLPPGEYLNVLFNVYLTKGQAVERVSLMHNGTTWVPVGYVLSTEPATGSTPASAPNAAPAR